MAQLKFLKSFEDKKKILEKIFTKKKLHFQKSEFLEITKKENLEISITSSLDLVLLFKDIQDLELDIKINILENLDVNIFFLSQTKNFYKNVEINLGENSKLNFYPINFNSSFEKNKISIHKNCVCNIFGLNVISSNSFYQLNKIVHLGQNSKSLIDSFSFSKDGSLILVDNCTNICGVAKFSEGVQKLRGTILDSCSKIYYEPILEIENDEVQAEHSASITDLDCEVIFYLNSRGICKTFFEQILIRDIFENFVTSTKTSQKLLLVKPW